jgi:hypothetical protein
MKRPLFASPGDEFPPASLLAQLAVAWMALMFTACGTPSSKKGRLVLLNMPSSILERGYAPKKLALLIGIQNFDASEWGALRFTEKDAEDLARVLRSPAHGAFDRIEVLKNSPTRNDINAAIERLAAENLDERDTVVVYISSHGTLARNALGKLQRYLVTRESQLSNIANTALPLDELKTRFNALRSRRKVLILAACHSGGGKSLLPESLAYELAGVKGQFFVRPIEEVSRASIVLAASDWGETAREDEKLENDIYTHFFVEALRKSIDRNGDGAITVTEAHDHARQKTYDFTAGRQRPSAEFSMVGIDPIVLVGRIQRQGKPEIFSYASAWEGCSVLVDGREVLNLPGGTAVEPGKHRVQITKGTGPNIIDAAVELAPGARLDLAKLDVLKPQRFAIGLKATYLTFLRAKNRANIFVPSWGLSATYLDREWPMHRVNFRFDLSGAFGSGTLSTQTEAGQARVEYHLKVFAAGVALPWRFTPFSRERASLEILLGPRLSVAQFKRIYDHELLPQQTYGTLMPGIVGGVSWKWERLALGFETQFDYALFKINSANQSSGLAYLLLGGDWEF